MFQLPKRLFAIKSEDCSSQEGCLTVSSRASRPQPDGAMWSDGDAGLTAALCTRLPPSDSLLSFHSSSDNEEDRERAARNGRAGRSEFRDEEEETTPRSSTLTQAKESGGGSAARKRGGVPSKTVDLGAAAHYTGDKGSPRASKVSWGHQTHSDPLSNCRLPCGCLGYIIGRLTNWILSYQMVFCSK